MNPNFDDAIFDSTKNGNQGTGIDSQAIVDHMNGFADQFSGTKTEPTLRVRPEDLELDESVVNLMPKVIKQYLNYSAPLSDVPNEFLITPFLALSGAAIGNTRYVQLGGITIYPTFWTVLFAGSSTLRKSTALSLARQPFKPIEANLREHYQDELRHWENAREHADFEGKTFTDPKPIKRSLYCSDGFSDLTFWEGLRDNKSLISMPGEFTALWSELTRSRNAMRDLALSLFDAEDSVRRTTKAGGDIELNNPVWCIAGATTIRNFQRTLSRAERASGLLQRILPVCMENRTKPFKAITELEEPDSFLYNQITSKTTGLYQLEPQSVKLSTDARYIYTEWSYDLNERGEQLTQRIDNIGGYISRLNIYGMKIALIFQQLDRPGAPIAENNMQGAIGLCEWLLKHILYMLNNNYIFSQQYADRVKIRELIAKKPDNIITRTDLMNLSNFDKDQLDRALASEIDSGKIQKLKTDTGGRPLVQYKLVELT